MVLVYGGHTRMEDDLDFHDDYDAEPFYGTCGTCHWRGHVLCFRGESSDVRKAKGRLMSKHQQSHPGCKGELRYG